MNTEVMTAEQYEALEVWAGAMAFNARISQAEARSIILDWLRNGRATEVRDIVTLKFKPHTIRYTWKDRHFCPGYYDCTRCC